MQIKASLNNIEKLRVYLEFLLLEDDEFKILLPIRQKSIMIMILLSLAQELTNEVNKLTIIK